jgi:hypothetical protein
LRTKQVIMCAMHFKAKNKSTATVVDWVVHLIKVWGFLSIQNLVWSDLGPIHVNCWVQVPQMSKCYLLHPAVCGWSTPLPTIGSQLLYIYSWFNVPKPYYYIWNVAQNLLFSIA